MTSTQIVKLRAGARMSPGAVAAVAAVVALVVVTLRLSTFDWNPTGFVWASDLVVERDEAPPSLLVRSEISGFDGTGFYRFALDPFTRERTDFGILLDHPAFRHQRVLYPLVVWAATGGDAVRVGWALIALNLIGLIAIAWLGARIVLDQGGRAAWGWIFAANPAVALSLGLDTAEIVAATFLLATILALRRGRFASATAALTLAMLARETTLVLAAGGGLAWLWARARKRDPLVPLWVFLVPAIAYGIWEVVLRWWWGHWALASGAGLDITLPFVGIARGAADWFPLDEALDGLHVVLLVAIVLFVATAGRSLVRVAGLPHERAALGLAMVVVALTSDAIWFHHWRFLRATSELYTLGALVILSDARAPAYRLGVAPAIWLALWINMLLFP